MRGHVTISAASGLDAEVEIGCLVAGMAAGADSIDDMDVLRHGAHLLPPGDGQAR